MTRRFKPTGIPIEVGPTGSVGVPIFIQDQTTFPLDLWFLERLSATTTAADTTLGGVTFTATTGHGIVNGNVIEINNTVTFIQAIVTGVATDVITLDQPINHVYPSGSQLIVSNRGMNVVGTPASPRVFSIAPEAGQRGDFTRVLKAVTDATAMDFSTFGGVATLANGCVFRLKIEGGDFFNLFNWKNNGEFIIRGFDHEFQTKVGGGSHSFTARSTWAGQDKRGVALRVDGSRLEELQVLVQDDLTGLTSFNMVAQGHALQED
jgi:hypothetical protein